MENFIDEKAPVGAEALSSDITKTADAIMAAPLAAGNAVESIPPTQFTSGAESVIRLHPCTDLANAHRLARAFGDRLRVIDGKFHYFDGARWVRDTNGEAFRCAARLSTIVAEEARAARHKATAAWNAGKASERINRLNKEAAALEKWTAGCEMLHRMEAALRALKKVLR
jgi:D5 N terminal like